MLEGVEVAVGADDAQAEQVADAAGVAAGGVDLSQDAVSSEKNSVIPGFFTTTSCPRTGCNVESPASGPPPLQPSDQPNPVTGQVRETAQNFQSPQRPATDVRPGLDEIRPP